MAALVGGGAAGVTTWFFLAVLNRDPPTLLVPIVAVGLGMFTAHMVRTLTAEPEEAVDDEPAPKQTVGQSCSVCATRIRIAREAAECDDCGGVFHDDCFDDHVCA